MPKLLEQFRLAIIYWPTKSVGGIGTRLNTYRTVAKEMGDKCDIFVSADITEGPQLFKQRKWTHGGDTKIWIDGKLPHGERIQESIDFLEKNYDAVFYGFTCPHPCKNYPEPKFLPMYSEVSLPKVAFVSDTYWKKYSVWAEQCLPYIRKLISPHESYVAPARAVTDDVEIVPFPFYPLKVSPQRRKTPHLIWPNQWKNSKGVNQFFEIIPDLPQPLTIDLFSSGIRYYQMRTTDVWKAAVKEDHFSGYNGRGIAHYRALVDVPEMAKAFQQAWFSVNLHGIQGDKVYNLGSYNNTEVEALYYGCCPILHSSTLKTDIPKECYIAVDSASEIPAQVKRAIKTKFAISLKRQKLARDFVMDKHSGVKVYSRIKELLS